MTQHDLLALLDGRAGHFYLESGHHGELWLDLDALFLRPSRLAPFVEELAARLSRAAEIDAICGPLVGGALIAGAVAALLDRELYVAEPSARAAGEGGLFGARYAVPETIRGRLAGKRVAVVDDIVNAGSAMRATVTDLRAAGAEVVAVGALLVLGSRAADYTARHGLALEHLAAMPNPIWEPASCPRCAAGEPLEDPGNNAPARG
jgi:orotate phosphoribosyltransferase